MSPSSRHWLPSLTAVTALAFLALSSTARDHVTQPGPAAATLQAAGDPEPIPLVNKQHPLPGGYAPADLVTPAVLSVAPPGSTLLAASAANAAQDMFAAAAREGVTLTLASGYRSYTTQARVHDDLVSSLGPAAAGEASAPPGHSEHQTGLAVDIADGSGTCSFEPCFADQPAAVWAAANAHRFGFIIRYPAGAEMVTGYAYEPWHLRFVGMDAAAAIHSRGITLEEYLASTGPAA